jgi:hypothetical protein
MGSKFFSNWVCYQKVEVYQKNQTIDMSAPSLTNVLRIACDFYGLGTSGSAKVLSDRLKKAGAGKLIAKKGRSVCKQAKPKPKPTTSRSPLKGTKSGGVRLSAAYYFYDVCDGKISRCKPHMILQPDGRSRLKEIKLVNGVNGKCPRWVNVDCD